jgi:hypothetical protein
MNVKERNFLFLQGKFDQKGLFPQLEALATMKMTFDCEFGLTQLPQEPGLILIRGARQMGKSTWLESKIKKTVQEEGAGSALYLNGDEILNSETLFQEIQTCVSLFSSSIKTPKLFIDPIGPANPFL